MKLREYEQYFIQQRYAIGVTIPLISGVEQTSQYLMT